MDDETTPNATRAPFPTTRRTAVHEAASADPVVRRRAYGELIGAYWRPVYAYLRLKRRIEPEAARDLTQGFFAHAFERGQLEGYDPSRAAFRTFLRTCLDSFVSNELRAARRQKRGGDREVLSIDGLEGSAERILEGVTDDLEPEAFFHREWIRGLLARAVDRLRQRLRERDKEIAFVLFERYDLSRDPPERALTYADLARTFDLPVTQVTNLLALARRELRAILLDVLREVTASDREFREEARVLFGRTAP